MTTILRGTGGCTVNRPQLTLKLLCNCLPKCRKLSGPGHQGAIGNDFPPKRYSAARRAAMI
jgi:hypothetical protein